MYHSTNETPGTVGTLLCIKTTFLYLKRSFLDTFYLDFGAKNVCFSLKNTRKIDFCAQFQSKKHPF